MHCQEILQMGMPYLEDIVDLLLSQVYFVSPVSPFSSTQNKFLLYSLVIEGLLREKTLNESS